MIRLLKGDNFDTTKHFLISCNDKKWLYFKLGRTGGTSVYRRCLEKHFTGGQVYGGKLKGWIDRIDETNINEYFSFTFVRNPFDRIVSIALHFQHFTNLDVDGFIHNIGKYLTENIEDSESLSIWVHSKPCSTVTHIGDEQVINFIGRFENLQEDYDKLCKHLNIKTEKLAHLNKSKRDKPHYRDYYTEETKKIVSEIYARDLKLFNYKF